MAIIFMAATQTDEWYYAQCAYSGQAIGKSAASSYPSICTRHLFHHVAIAPWNNNSSLLLYHHPVLHPSLDSLV